MEGHVRVFLEKFSCNDDEESGEEPLPCPETDYPCLEEASVIILYCTEQFEFYYNCSCFVMSISTLGFSLACVCALRRQGPTLCVS